MYVNIYVIIIPFKFVVPIDIGIVPNLIKPNQAFRVEIQGSYFKVIGYGSFKARNTIITIIKYGTLLGSVLSKSFSYNPRNLLSNIANFFLKLQWWVFSE